MARRIKKTWTEKDYAAEAAEFVACYGKDYCWDEFVYEYCKDFDSDEFKRPDGDLLRNAIYAACQETQS